MYCFLVYNIVTILYEYKDVLDIYTLCYILLLL